MQSRQIIVLTGAVVLGLGVLGCESSNDNDVDRRSDSSMRSDQGLRASDTGGTNTSQSQTGGMSGSNPFGSGQTQQGTLGNTGTTGTGTTGTGTGTGTGTTGTGTGTSGTGTSGFGTGTSGTSGAGTSGGTGR